MTHKTSKHTQYSGNILYNILKQKCMKCLVMANSCKCTHNSKSFYSFHITIHLFLQMCTELKGSIQGQKVLDKWKFNPYPGNCISFSLQKDFQFLLPFYFLSWAWSPLGRNTEFLTPASNFLNNLQQQTWK